MVSSHFSFVPWRNASYHPHVSFNRKFQPGTLFMRTLLLITILVLTSCSAVNIIFLENNEYKLDTPEGTAIVSDNLFSSITETSNDEYKSYLEWLGRIYGYNSQNYLEALPDTLVFQKHTNPQYGEPYIPAGKYYFHHPGFNDYPIVGIDLKQATAYCNWKTIVETKDILTKKNLIEEILHPDSSNHFTIQRYLDGSFDWIRKQQEIPFPSYQVPNSDEWETIAGKYSGFTYGVDSIEFFNSKPRDKHKGLFHTQDQKDSYGPHMSVYVLSLQASVESYSENVFGLRNTIGNVSEIVRDSSISKGGSFKAFVKDIGINGSEEFIEPNYWTGFRCVCKYELLKNE